MEAITYSYARENLAKTMQQACDDHEPYGGGGIHLQIFIVKTFALNHCGSSGDIGEMH